MAQTGYTPIQLYYSSTTTNVPLAANLAYGELAINITDGKLFYKDNANAVQVIGWKVTPATAGGTGQTSYAVGDLLYADTTTSLAKLPDVATGNALISGGVGVAPSWGKIGLTTHVSGTLPTANGGTNLTSFTANGVMYASSSSVLATGSVFTFDGTNAALSLSQNASTKFTLTNSNAGTSAVARYEASNGSNTTEFGIRGTAQTTSGVLAPQVGYMYSPSAAGAAIVAAAGPLYFAAGGTTEGAKLDSSNNFTIGTTTAYTNAAFTSLNVGGSKSGKVGLIGLFNASDTLQATLDTYSNQFRIGTNGTTNPIIFKLGGSVTDTLTLDSSLNVTVNAGNVVQGTAAKGFDFSANTPAAGKTSTLLNWYEEGTWTPNQGAGLTLVGAFSSTGRYTRIGRQVSISGTVTGATSVAVTAAGVITSNLPFTVVTAGHGDATNVAINASATVICTSTNVTAASAIAATATITFSATYFV